MVYIKKLHLHGFKSFARPTDIVFDRGMNVIVGPNGAGKSNLADAICFVLGRLKVRTMRATKAANFIYDGGKEYKPAQNAKVSMVFDNADRVFALPAQEVAISRIVRRDGTSVYKINDDTKTRQEMLELLSQAGIDAEGFNIILQAEISSIIAMHSEDKRKIIEEAAGISIYEERKEKSLHELEKTDERLKEVKTILNERSSYLKNLESERAQALKYQNLKKSVGVEKASIIWQKIKEKKKALGKVDEEIGERTKIIEKLRLKEQEFKSKISEAIDLIKKIEQEMQNETGIEQDKLRGVILELKTELASLNVKKENTNDKIVNLEKRSEHIKEQLKTLYEDLSALERQSQSYDKEEVKKDSKRAEEINNEIKEIKQKMSEIEAERENYNLTKLEISKKDFQLSENNVKLKEIDKKLFEIKEEIKTLIKTSSKANIEEIRQGKSAHEKKLDDIKEEIHKIEKDIFGILTKKEIHEKDISAVLELNKCPKCKQALTKEYKEALMKELKEAVGLFEKDKKEREKSQVAIKKEAKNIAEQIAKFVEQERKYHEALEITHNIKIKETEQEKLRIDQENIIVNLSRLNEEIKELKETLKSPEFIDESYSKEKAKLEKLQETLMKIKLNMPIYEEHDYNVEMTVKKREIENSNLIIKRARQEKLELEFELKEFMKNLTVKQKELLIKERDSSEIEKKFKNSIDKKQKLQDLIHQNETSINEQQTSRSINEMQFNDLKIDKARLEAETSSLDAEFKEYNVVENEIVSMRIDELEIRLKKHEEILQTLGSVNLRALEVYDKIKAEYDEIAQKAAKIEEEKGEILKIIAEVDKKKKQAFMQAFNAVNSSFSDNFVSLSNKGRAFLELENKQDPFAGGMDIIIKIARGKERSADALSGGEKVIVALALMFAIQKYKPYCFYIFDEIDPALDRRNSEILATILRGNVKGSQCIIISHNDAIINNADRLYGTSMQEGISKILTLKV